MNDSFRSYVLMNRYLISKYILWSHGAAISSIFSNTHEHLEIAGLELDSLYTFKVDLILVINTYKGMNLKFTKYLCKKVVLFKR